MGAAIQAGVLQGDVKDVLGLELTRVGFFIIAVVLLVGCQCFVVDFVFWNCDRSGTTRYISLNLRAASCKKSMRKK